MLTEAISILSESKVSISPGTEVHVQEGSELKLECRIQGCPHADPYWTRDGQTLLRDYNRGPPLVGRKNAVLRSDGDQHKLVDLPITTFTLRSNKTKRSKTPRVSQSTTISNNRADLTGSSTAPIAVANITRLDVTTDHSGVYMCASTCTLPVNVTVHVVRG